MKELKNSLENKTNLRTQYGFPEENIEFIDISPLLMQPEVYKEVIAKLVVEIKKHNPDYIISPESRGFLFGTTIAHILNIGCVPVRKRGKIPPNFVAATAKYEKEYGLDEIELPILVNESYTGKKFYILDDIYATGNTISAIRNAVVSLGGKVVGQGAIINLVELNNDEVFSLIEAEETAPVRKLEK